MVVYEIFGVEQSEYCCATSDAGVDAVLRASEGQPSSSWWQPVEVNIVHRERGTTLKHSDALWLGCPLAFRAPVLSALAAIWKRHGEVLPLACAEDDVYLFNALPPVAALDHDASDLVYFENSRRVMAINKHAFKPSVVDGLEIFRLSEYHAPLFTSESFKRHWTSAGFSGINFVQVWSD